jgi:hypothetical protein
MDLVGITLAGQAISMKTIILAFVDACEDVQTQMSAICDEHTHAFPIGQSVRVDVDTNTGILPHSTPEEIGQVNTAILDAVCTHSLVSSVGGREPRYQGMGPIIELCQDVLRQDDYLATLYVFLTLMHMFKPISATIAEHTPRRVMERYCPAYPTTATDPPSFFTRYTATFQGTPTRDAMHPIDGVLSEISHILIANKAYAPT